MVGIALIREENHLMAGWSDKVCIGVYKDYEAAMIAMAENRREWKAVHTIVYEDAESFSVPVIRESDGLEDVENVIHVSYEMISVQKIEA